MHTHYSKWLDHLPLGLKVCMGLLLWFGLMPPTWAVFIWSPYTPVRSVTMQVGTPGSTIDKVTINVPGNAISPTSTLTTGTANGPTTSVTGGIEIRVTNNVTTTPAGSYLTVNSSVGLSCVAGSGCGSTVIPFSVIGWTSYNHDTTYGSYDIQNGTFNNSTNQPMTGFTFSGQSITMSNIVVFHYNSSTVYPAGRYTGRVTYTASIP